MWGFFSIMHLLIYFDVSLKDDESKYLEHYDLNLKCKILNVKYLYLIPVYMLVLNEKKMKYKNPDVVCQAKVILKIVCTSHT